MTILTDALRTVSGAPRPGHQEVKWLTLRRSHGLGNIICLLPVLDRLYEEGFDVNLVTRSEWVQALAQLRPCLLYNAQAPGEVIDLDAATEHLEPTEHRTDEFARLLGVSGPLPAPRLRVPEAWQKPFRDLRGGVVLAPEGGHPSRCWPVSRATRLHGCLTGERLIVVGTRRQGRIAADVDLRGRLELHDLLGLLSLARAVVTMDSGILHLAAALDVPTVALFGGVDPGFRVRPEQRVVILQADLPCCPCNKQETCDNQFPCIRNICPTDVARALEQVRHVTGRHIVRLAPVQISLVGVD